MTGDNFLNIIKQTTSESNKNYPQLQAVGTTIYYVWYEDYYIWTATSNLDGTEFTPTKQTSSSADSLDLQFQVVGTTIYYVFIKGDVNHYQIWTATSNLDGTGFTPTKQTTSAIRKEYPQLQVVDTTIYYVWIEDDHQIWTATSNLDGTGFTPTIQTTSANYYTYPQLQVVGTTIYYVINDWINDQILTATSNLDGTGFTLTQQPTPDLNEAQIQVVDTTIYYVLSKWDGYASQIWIATSDLDGTNFNLTKITVSAFDKYEPHFQVVGTKIYYMWLEYDVDYNFQIWTGTSNIDGTEPTSTKQTANVFSKEHQRLQVMGTTIYYIWSEYDINWYNQIWTATSNPASLMVSFANILGRSPYRSTGASVSGGIECGRGKKR